MSSIRLTLGLTEVPGARKAAWTLASIKRPARCPVNSAGRGDDGTALVGCGAWWRRQMVKAAWRKCRGAYHSPLFRGMPTRPEVFWGMLGVSGLRSCTRTHLKKRPCATLARLVGCTTNAIGFGHLAFVPGGCLLTMTPWPQGSVSPHVFACFDRIEFIGQYLRRFKRGMPTESSIFAPATHESLFVRGPYHKTTFCHNFTRWDVG